MIPKGLFRLIFILVNNAYCIPTYVMWVVLLYPLRKLNADFFWKLEGYFFHWLLAMVSMWSWSAGYDIVEMGDDIKPCLHERTLVIANHQSTADVPMLMACFNAKPNILPNIMWVMDRMFKFTNFGIVSILHQDFFITSGRTNRMRSIQELMWHLKQSYLPLCRKWIILFPEGGFLRKRRENSQNYARKLNLPVHQHVTLPRLGAFQGVLDTVGPSVPIHREITARVSYVLDITIAYPKGRPLDLQTIVFGNRQPCKTILLYRLYPGSEIPSDSSDVAKWLYERFAEKEQILQEYYDTDELLYKKYCREPVAPTLVRQDSLRFLILHAFFIASTYIHYHLICFLLEYLKALFVK